MDEAKIQQMQFLEQNLQSISMQKQSFQMELNEVLSALKEIESSKEDVYKVVGQLMIKSDREKVLVDLKEREKLIGIRIGSLEKQEEKFGEQLQKIRNELLGSINKE